MFGCSNHHLLNAFVFQSFVFPLEKELFEPDPLKDLTQLRQLRYVPELIEATSEWKIFH